MPLCIINWASPTLRRKVVLPPWLGPVMRTSGFPLAETSFPTTRRSTVRARVTSYNPVAENWTASAGAGCEKATGSPNCLSRS